MLEINDLTISINDRYSIGSTITKQSLIDTFVVVELTQEETHQDKLIEDEAKIVKVIEENKVPKKDKISLSEIDDRLMTIDDFLK